MPVGTSFPYITYTMSYEEGFLDDLLQVRIWSKNPSMTEINTIVDKIGDRIGEGITIDCVEGGKMWLKKGSPFAQFLNESDEVLKVVYINLTTNILI